jgi:hypothetical protein
MIPAKILNLLIQILKAVIEILLAHSNSASSEKAQDEKSHIA